MPNRPLGYALLRVVTGINMLLHGGIRILGGYSQFVKWVHKEFQATFLPEVLLTLVGYGIPVVEVLIGCSLVVGFMTLWGLVLSGFLMGTLVFGMCLLQNWGTVADQMIYTAVFAALLFGLEYNRFSLDHYFFD